MKKNILLATTNQGKLKEIQSLLSSFSLDQVFHIKTLKDFPEIPEIPETESTFLGNALLKARAYNFITKLPVISDDSGLVVPALGDEPGVYSARYAGENATFDKNIDLLLERIKNIQEKNAYFTSCIVFLQEENLYTVSEGYCFGNISTTPVGTNGFGYDPIFYLQEYGCTMAQIPLEEKQKISHRAKALKQLIQTLECYAKQY